MLRLSQNRSKVKAHEMEATGEIKAAEPCASAKFRWVFDEEAIRRASAHDGDLKTYGEEMRVRVREMLGRT